MAKKVGFTLMSSSFISFPYHAYGWCASYND
jgi:hypothetical protein